MTSAKRILLIDDETALRRSLAEQVEQQGGFAVVEATTIPDALEHLSHGRFDAVLINTGQPNPSGHQDGREVSQALRRAGVQCPVILLTAPEAVMTPGPESGVTECISRPFRLGALVARLRALVARFEKSAEIEVVVGPYRFRPVARLLSRAEGGDAVRLTEKETAILGYLLCAGNTVTGRDTLLAAVWGYNANVTTHTLETHVYRLRQKIEDDPANARLLITEPGGYRLVP